MQSKPLISVMILCYNYSTLLKKALNACSKQVFKDFEIVMIDNGSTDNTKQVFDNFCLQNPEIETQYIKIENNNGPTAGWNTGIPYAKGEYLIFNDADDWMEPNCLLELSREAQKSHADRIVGQYQEVLPDGKITRIRKFPKKSAKLPSAMLQGTLFKKSIIELYGLRFPKDILIPYDFYFVYNFAIKEKSSALVFKTIYNYYYNPTSITQKSSTNLYIENNFLPLINITEDAINSSTTKELSNQMEYLFLRNIYSNIVSQYMNLSKNTADKLYGYMKDELNSKISNYQQNPFLNPFFNGFPFAGSFATWFLIKIEKLNLIGPFCHIISKTHFTKYLKKKI